MACRGLVLPTGTANLASVLAAFRPGSAPRTLVADRCRRCSPTPSGSCCPASGPSGRRSTGLREPGLRTRSRAASRADRPTLCDLRRPPDRCSRPATRARRAAGLAVSRAGSADSPTAVRVPQFGWNRMSRSRAVAPGAGLRLFRQQLPGRRSARLAIATAEHGGRFLAGLERDNVVACQFHPELSGAYGHALIARWLEGA